VISAIERGVGRKVPFAVKPRRAGDPPVVFAETSLARKTLGFVPELSDLDTIVRTAAPTFGINVRHDADAYVDLASPGGYGPGTSSPISNVALR
jgi:UDP-glucose 4-epimerase